MFTTDLCLLCLKNDSKLTSISSKDNNGVTINEKLQFFISKQIKTEPKDTILYICLPCLDKLNNVYNYKQLCLKNICRFNSFVHEQVTLIDTNINDSITTENCNKNTANNKQEDVPHKNEIKFEFVDVIVKEEPEYNCDITDIKTELNEPDNNEESTPKINTVKCKLMKCDVCEKTFIHQSSFRRHKLIHSGVKAFKCDICDKTFTQNCHLEAHKRCHSGHKPYLCDICEKGFSQRSHLTAHKRCHSGVKPFICDVCNKAFNKKYHLLTHKRCHSGDKPFTCDLCDKMFNHRSNLMQHKKWHAAKNL